MKNDRLVPPVSTGMLRDHKIASFVASACSHLRLELALGEGGRRVGRHKLVVEGRVVRGTTSKPGADKVPRGSRLATFTSSAELTSITAKERFSATSFAFFASPPKRVPRGVVRPWPGAG